MGQQRRRKALRAANWTQRLSTCHTSASDYAPQGTLPYLYPDHYFLIPGFSSFFPALDCISSTEVGNSIQRAQQPVQKLSAPNPTWTQYSPNVIPMTGNTTLALLFSTFWNVMKQTTIHPKVLCRTEKGTQHPPQLSPSCVNEPFHTHACCSPSVSCFLYAFLRFTIHPLTASALPEWSEGRREKKPKVRVSLPYSLPSALLEVLWIQFKERAPQTLFWCLSSIQLLDICSV